MNKDEILTLSKQKGIKLSFLNSLINGYRGKLTEWKNNKTTLTENEIKIITDYLLAAEVEKKPTRIIPLADMAASAGLGNDVEYVEWAKIPIPDIPETRLADFAVPVRGDSMEPEYFSGDIVLVNEQPIINIGKIGVFILDGNSYIKEFGGDRLISLNNKYGDIILNENSTYKCCGLVICKLTDLA